MNQKAHLNFKLKVWWYRVLPSSIGMFKWRAIKRFNSNWTTPATVYRIPPYIIEHPESISTLQQQGRKNPVITSRPLSFSKVINFSPNFSTSLSSNNEHSFQPTSTQTNTHKKTHFKLQPRDEGSTGWAPDPTPEPSANSQRQQSVGFHPLVTFWPSSLPLKLVLPVLLNSNDVSSAHSVSLSGSSRDSLKRFHSARRKPVFIGAELCVWVSETESETWWGTLRKGNNGS